jgi:mannan endo-1,4-beta-mannosidase
MPRKPRSRIVVTLLAVVTAALSLCAGSSPAGRAHSAHHGKAFVKRAGPELRLRGETFRFAGSSNYYLMYKSRFMVDEVLEAASDQGFRVMRIWGSLDIGNQDGSNSIRGKADGVYFQYWDGTAPAYNDGADGLQRLDYVIARAGELGLRLVIPFVNNWNDFGGMDQYVRWRDSSTPDDQSWFHDSFYTDPVIKQWYRDWISHLLNRRNSLTGVRYKDDPTIMTWELGNEPRCLSAGAYPRSPSCTTSTLIRWADEMSTYVKRIDNKHLVSVGDEGFYCRPNGAHWTENCGEGVDTLAFTKLKNVDVMSFHLYPDSWGTDVAWGTEWIERHFRDARKLGKPAMLGEFGLLDKSMRNPNYKLWTDTVFRRNGAGALYWILSGLQDDGTLYPDFDGFTVYCPTPVCTTIRNFGAMMAADRQLLFPPVADHDAAVTEFETAVTLDPTANDVAYGRAAIVAGSLDLDPATAGRQTNATVAGGTFDARPDGTVVFTPNAGFAGRAQASYVVSDSKGRRSNEANLVVTVNPDPSAPILLAGFESGTEGWAPGNWQANAGTVSQSTDFATEGTHSLRFDAVDGGWVGITFPSPVDLTGKTHVKADIRTLGTGTSQDISLQIGPPFEWCQGNFTFVQPNTTATTDVDLVSAFSCDISTRPMNDVRGMYVFFSGNGTFYLDNVRAE